MPETTQFGTTEDNYGDEGALKPNTILINRYKVLGTLGGGGQGAVYQCRDLNFPDAKRLVALKEMHYPGDASMRATTMQTFQREANILATLAHPAIPKIFDFFDQNNRAYLVMEYINGNDLENLLTKTKELPLDKIVEWAIDLCDVLHYLHSHSPDPIIFRDVKPANIMIDSLGKVRLIDFGIAKIFVSGVKNTMIGTEGYSAPEQYKGDVNPLSDIYSLGATLHHIVTRKDPRLEPPFSFSERPLRQFNENVSPGLEAVINKSLETEPANRFSSCEEMKQSLLAVRYNPAAAQAQSVPGAGTQTGMVGTDFFDGEDLFGSIEPRWKFKTEDEIRGGPTSFRGLAFVGSYDTNVWAIDIESGDFRWKYATNGGIAVAPTVDEGSKLVLFGSEDHSFTALDYHTGRISWSYTANDRIRCTARVAHDHVFFGSDDGRVYALVSGTGRYLWEYDMGGPVRGQPYVTRDLIIVGAETGDLVGLELSGQRKWSYRTRRAINAAPLVDEVEGICYIGSFDGYMYALDASSGYSMWRYRTNGPIISAAVLANDLLIFGSADGTLYAINSESSKEKWRFSIEKPIVSSPIIHKGKVYFGGTDSYFYCLELKTGKELWKFQTEDSITSAPYVTENVILVGSMDRTLYALPLVD
jgi:eukaryotic-like serine/threonine-protein kinase